MCVSNDDYLRRRMRLIGFGNLFGEKCYDESETTKNTILKICKTYLVAYHCNMHNLSNIQLLNMELNHKFER